MQRKKKGISNETNLPLLQLFYFCMIFIEQKIANHNHNLGQFSTDDFHLILAVGIGQGKKKVPTSISLSCRDYFLDEEWGRQKSCSKSNVAISSFFVHFRVCPLRRVISSLAIFFPVDFYRTKKVSLEN